MPGPPKVPNIGGVQGVLGNVRDMGHLVALLKPYFLPASLGSAPHSNPTAAMPVSSGGGSGTAAAAAFGSISLEQLSDVKVFMPTDGQALAYVAAYAKWENTTVVLSVSATAPLASSGGVNPNISLTGIVPILNGGTGSSTQNFVDVTTDQTIGGNKTFSNPVQGPNGFQAGPSAYYPYGCYINGALTVATGLSAASATLSAPLPITSGGTGTVTPALVAGTNITITGVWPNQTISATSSGGTVTAVTASAPLASSGGTTPNISLTSPLPIVNGGTGSTTQNFVDLSSAQTKAGVLTFSSPPVLSGASITSGTIPNAALVTAPVTAVTASAPLSSSGGTTPNISLATPLAVAYGGTGSATQNFVDLSSAQTIAGIKTFSSPPVHSGASITSGTVPNAALVTLPVTSVVAGTGVTVTGAAPNPTVALTVPVAIASGGTGSTTQNFVDLTSTQSVGGAKTLTAALAGTSATFSGAIAGSTGTFSAPVSSARSAGGVAAYLPPLYAANGVAFANTTHLVTGRVNIAFSASTTATVSVTLTAAAIFADTNYNVTANLAGPTANIAIYINPSATNTIIFTGVAAAALTGTYTILWVAIGA